MSPRRFFINRIHMSGEGIIKIVKHYYKSDFKKPYGLGGEVTNDSDVHWLISHGSNSNPNDFLWLPPGKNSDEYFGIKDLDIDAVWAYPYDRKVYYVAGPWPVLVERGVFKLRDHRNVNITGTKVKGYKVYDASQYFLEGKFPQGWKLPPRNLLPKMD